MHHSSISQVSIIGVPDDKYGEELGAFIELREGVSEKPSDDELRAFVREKLARFKAPRYIWWIGADEWPKTTSGKISKPELRERVKGEFLPLLVVSF